MRKRPSEFELKERTVGILGQKGTGKTFLTRAIIHGVDRGAVIYDTIGALNVENAKKYEVMPEGLETQALVWGELSSLSKANVSVNLHRLTQKEIVYFCDIALRVAHYKNKVIAVDEIADFLPERTKKSQEMERLIRHGRNEGCTFIFNTQRPAQISKNTLNLVDVLICFRLVWNRDLTVIKELLNNLGEENIDKEIKAIANQGVGEYRVYVFHH